MIKNSAGYLGKALMESETVVWVPIISAFVGVLGGVLTTLLSLRSERRRVRDQLTFERKKFEEEITSQRAALQAEFGTEESAEAAIKHFLDIQDLPYRSFPMIQHHIGGFGSNDLRQLLVRSGAVRFMAQDGTEMWALWKNVPDQFKAGRRRLSEAPQNKAKDSELFPAAFNKEGEF